MAKNTYFKTNKLWIGLLLIFFMIVCLILAFWRPWELDSKPYLSSGSLLVDLFMYSIGFLFVAYLIFGSIRLFFRATKLISITPDGTVLIPFTRRGKRYVSNTYTYNPFGAKNDVQSGIGGELSSSFFFQFKKDNVKTAYLVSDQEKSQLIERHEPYIKKEDLPLFSFVKNPKHPQFPSIRFNRKTLNQDPEYILLRIQIELIHDVPFPSVFFEKCMKKATNLMAIEFINPLKPDAQTLKKKRFSFPDVPKIYLTVADSTSVINSLLQK